MRAVEDAAGRMFVRRWRVVVGVDGSAASQAALDWAMKAAVARDGEVYVVHAWQRGAEPATAGPPAYPHRRRDAAEALLLKMIRSTPRPRGTMVISQAVEGVPAEVLVAATREADLLVLGRSGGRHGIERACRDPSTCPVVTESAASRHDGRQRPWAGDQDRPVPVATADAVRELITADIR